MGLRPGQASKSRSIAPQLLQPRRPVWLSRGNHNHLRITRILRCSSLLGLEAEAKAFFDCLSEICDDEQNKPLPAISDETMLYWREAVGDAGRRVVHDSGN